MPFLLGGGNKTAVFVKYHRGDMEIREFCNLIQLGFFGKGADQRKGNALFSGAAGSADAVDIIFVLIRNVIVDYAVHVIYVNAA